MSIKFFNLNVKFFSSKKKGKISNCYFVFFYLFSFFFFIFLFIHIWWTECLFSLCFIICFINHAIQTLSQSNWILNVFYLQYLFNALREKKSKFENAIEIKKKQENRARKDRQTDRQTCGGRFWISHIFDCIKSFSKRVINIRFDQIRRYDLKIVKKQI